jgi:prolyl oligopeptidase
MRYPAAPRLELSERKGGRQIDDPYRWLEDPDDPQAVSWSAQQDVLARTMLDALPGREVFADRLRALLHAGQEGPPVPRGPVGFRLRRAPEQQHGVVVAGPLDDPATFTTLVDPHELDPSGVTTLDAWSPSPDGRLLAYQLSTGGTEESAISVLEASTGAVVDGPIDRTRYSPIAWLPDSGGFYYVRQRDAGVPFDRRVHRHLLGADPSADEEVFGAGHDRRTYFGVSLSRDGRWLVVSASVGTAPRDDVWIADLHGDGRSRSEFMVVQQGVDARCHASVAFDGRLYVWTDANAPRGRLCVADPARPQEWTTLIAEDPEAVLTDYAVLASEIVLVRSRHAISEVSVVSRADGAFVRDVSLPGIGAVSGVTAAREGGPDAWLSYTDALTPPGVLDLTGGVWAAAPGAVDISGISASIEVAHSADGTPVRIQTLAPEEAAPDFPPSPAPTVLYGYGGFGISLEPAYSATALAWVQSGGVWAVAQLRGGGEEGEQWHRAGMREHKQNVFADFEAAARHLRGSGRASRLGISGGSNGGLLVGAAVTREPHLYDAVVCSAPLLDMVRYELFGLGSTWNDEYGTASDPAELAWLLSYSPLHAVRAGTAYPPVLVEVFDGDTRVDPLHGRKFVAALQWAVGDGASDHGSGPILLRRESDVGHSSRSVDRTIGVTVDSLSFLAAHLGLSIG